MSIFIWILLLLVPSTSWIVRTQFKAITSGEYIPSHSDPQNRRFELINPERAYLDIAADHADDLQLQTAIQLSLGSHADETDLFDKSKVEMLLPLLRKFPNRPELISCLIRMYLRVKFPFSPSDKIMNPDHYRGMNAIKPTELTASQKSKMKDACEAIISLAQRGVRIEPDNAFFPIVYARALFALERDEEALGQVHIAARCNAYHDYIEDDKEGIWKLHLLTSSDRSILRHSSISEIYPSLGNPFREVARFTCAQAVLKERRHDILGGLALRKDILSLSSLIRTNSRSSLDASMGIWTIGTALPDRKHPKYKSVAEGRAGFRTMYKDYLNEIGAPKEADRYLLEIKYADETENIVHKYYVEELSIFPVEKKLSLLWLVEIVAAANLLWSTVFSLLFSFLVSRRNARIKSGYRADDIMLYTLCGLILMGLVGTLHKSQASGILANAHRYTEFNADFQTLLNQSIPNYYELPHAYLKGFACAIAVPLVLIFATVIPTLFRRSNIWTRILRNCQIVVTSGALLLSFVAAGILIYTAVLEHRGSTEFNAYHRNEMQYVASKYNFKMGPRVMPDD